MHIIIIRSVNTQEKLELILTSNPHGKTHAKEKTILVAKKQLRQCHLSHGRA